MANHAESSLDRLWEEYRQVFVEFDDIRLARWLAQTLSQFHGRIWRLSHPLIGAYRLAAQLGHERQIWLKRLAVIPANYPEADCCRAPVLPLLTRDVLEAGLICLHCNSTMVPEEEIPEELRSLIRPWAEAYSAVHAVAHQDPNKRLQEAEVASALETAAREAERLLGQVRQRILPAFLDYYPAVIWEDQDECLEVRPEDIPLS